MTVLVAMSRAMAVTMAVAMSRASRLRCRSRYVPAGPGPPSSGAWSKNGRGLGWLIDTRGHGGYVVAAGSTVAGRPYTVTRERPVAPLPPWLFQRLSPPSRSPQPTPAAVSTRNHSARSRREMILCPRIVREHPAMTGNRRDWPGGADSPSGSARPPNMLRTSVIRDVSAEGEGFEPTRTQDALAVFKTAAIGH